MRRGRIFTRGMRYRPRPAQAPLGAGPQRALIRANRLMEVGDFANAAQLYDNLARGAHDFGRPRQAAHLYLQAARALLLDGQISAGLNVFFEGLRLLATVTEWARVDEIGNRAITELNRNGYPQPAQDIGQWLEANRPAGLPASSQAARPQPVSRRPFLPANCPSCGATLRPDEIEWLDETSAECAYCGSIIKPKE